MAGIGEALGGKRSRAMLEALTNCPEEANEAEVLEEMQSRSAAEVQGMGM